MQLERWWLGKWAGDKELRFQLDTLLPHAPWCANMRWAVDPSWKRGETVSKELDVDLTDNLTPAKAPASKKKRSRKGSKGEGQNSGGPAPMEVLLAMEAKRVERELKLEYGEPHCLSTAPSPSPLLPENHTSTTPS